MQYPRALSAAGREQSQNNKQSLHCSIHCGDCPLPPLKGVERDNILLKSNLDIAVAVWSHVGASRFNDPFQISSEAPPFEPWMVSCKKGYVCIQAFSLSHLLH